MRDLWRLFNRTAGSAVMVLLWAMWSFSGPGRWIDGVAFGLAVACFVSNLVDARNEIVGDFDG